MDLQVPSQEAVYCLAECRGLIEMHHVPSALDGNGLIFVERQGGAIGVEISLASANDQ